MKRIEVELSLPVVAPLLDVIRELSDRLGQGLASPLGLQDLDDEFRDAWIAELLASQGADVQTLLGLFNDEFFTEGVVAFDEENAEPILRACAAIRLTLREKSLRKLGDETLESGEIDLSELDEPVRRAFMCYLFLATVQELIIQHLEKSILDS